MPLSREINMNKKANGTSRNEFANYKNPSKLFDSFNGTEIKCFVKVPTGYDEYGRVSTFEIVEFGTISALSGIEQYTVEPVPTIGFSRPTGIALGSSIVTGSMTFEVLNQGFVNDMKKILKEAGIKNISIDFEDKDNNEVPIYSTSEIEEINDFPNIDLILIGVKENDPNKKIQKQILGVRFNQGQSGIGITQISVREQYSFLAQKMEDFKPVIGASEDAEGEEYDDTMFGQVIA